MTCNFFSELCCLFCCPPCPGKIAAKLAFLPPEPTYAFTPDETGSKFSLTLTERAEWQYSEREKENIEVDLAARYEVGAVVLHSPLMSGMRVAFPNTKRTWFFDAFPSIDKIPKVTSPVLVIHGTEDEVIDFSHGLAIYERCPRAVEPLWVEGAGHNDTTQGDDQNPASTLSSANVNDSLSPHHARESDKRSENKEPSESAARSPRVAHNISISVTDADSPAGVRRRVHLRSLSDVTPSSRSLAPRARSHSERPRASPAATPARSPALARPLARAFARAFARAHAGRVAGAVAAAAGGDAQRALLARGDAARARRAAPRARRPVAQDERG
ncbi:unnamed protein product, partial [Iphiclides podalirius]